MTNINKKTTQNILAKGSPKHSPLDQLVEENKIGKFRLNLWAIGILIIALLVSANYAYLDEVAIATGEVVPQEQLQVVQHLEGGIIDEIYVHEGSYVEAGNPLMRLNLGASAVNRKEIQASLDGLRLRSKRLQAEINNEKAVNFSQEVATRQPDVVASEKAIFSSRKRELASRTAISQQIINQRKLEIDELLAHQASLKRDLALAQERLSMSHNLLRQELVSKMEHLNLEAEVTRMQGEMDVMQSSLPRTKAAYQEAIAQLNEEKQAFTRRAIEEEGDVQRKISQLRESLDTASEQAGRSFVRAPIEGIVKTLRFNTLGGVVKPGEPIMDIVPTSDELVVRAKLDPKDRGYVVKGQKANVKVTTFDYARYGDLEGMVEHIAASTDMTQDGIAYYTVVVKTDKNYLGEEKGEYAIQPGMQATVDIHTGQRTVLDFIIRPVLKLRHEAFRER